MDEILTVEQLQERLLELAKPLAALDLPLLDSHGATLANDLLVDEQLAIKMVNKLALPRSHLPHLLV